jgi:branched-chain amino acid aminotransferase
MKSCVTSRVYTPQPNYVKAYPQDCFAYNKFMIRTWKLNDNSCDEIYFSDDASLDAIGRQLPDGYYSTFRTYAGCTRVLGLRSHLQRLPDVNASSLRRQLIQLLEPYRPDEARVRVVMTFKGQVYILIEPLKLLPHEVYEKGVCVETTATQRNDPRIKSTAFITRSEEDRKHIAEVGVFEALMVKNGKILEGMTSNFFYILRAEGRIAQSKRTIIFTAQRDILLGVTRRTVIRVARQKGMDVRYSPLKLDQLSAVKEAFITSSSRGIIPVIQIDDVVVGEGRVGKITQMLMSAYEENVLKTAEKI